MELISDEELIRIYLKGDKLALRMLVDNLIAACYALKKYQRSFAAHYSLWHAPQFHQ